MNLSVSSSSKHCSGGIFPVYVHRKRDYNECGHYHLDLLLFKLANVNATSESICSYYAATNPKMHQVGFGLCEQRQLNVQFPHFGCFPRFNWAPWVECIPFTSTSLSLSGSAVRLNGAQLNSSSAFYPHFAQNPPGAVCLQKNILWFRISRSFPYRQI